MIVAALDLENYKHYAGQHHIDFPEQGVVAVTGPNGAGKTTLFEAIEWCLYCPRSIPQATVPARDGIGRTMVRVTLEDPADGRRYCVERELRTAGTQAEIYAEDDESQPIVQGTREVSRYVARTLIGLPHAAFVSTFFTKQKELQFFGDRSATERRTEVGRLLGLEAVRDAQREIGEGRTGARSLAESLRGEYARRLAGRDLAQEREAAVCTVSAAEMREGEAEQAAAAALETSERAQAELERRREQQAQDAKLGQDLAELNGAAREAAARRDAAVEALQRLDGRAAERAELAVAARLLDQHALAVAAHEQYAEQARQLRALTDTLQSAMVQVDGLARQVAELVERHRAAAVGLDNWQWTDSDGRDVVAAALRLYAVSAALDPGACRERVERSRDALRFAQKVQEVDGELSKYRILWEKLSNDRVALLRAGDPEKALDTATRQVRDARAAEQAERMALAAAHVERQESERLAESLRQHAGDLVCPTCSRPLGSQESARLTEELTSKIEKLEAEEHGLKARIGEAARRVAAAEQTEQAVRARHEQVRALAQRLADGQTRIDETMTRRELAETSLSRALAVIGAKLAPTAEEIEQERLQAEKTQQIAGLAGLLDRLGSDARGAYDAQREAQEAIQAIGAVDYDVAVHQSAIAALQASRRAAAQLEQIDVELASRGAYEQQRAQEVGTLAELTDRREAVEAERRALGFDAESLQAAIGAEQAARQAAHEAREIQVAARQAVRDARSALERLTADHLHLQQLIERADEQTREADELTRMYDEFGEFDRYVARHVGPLLAETTERMLSQVTNGKYDHVQFDENYGIEVFDGDEAFPLSSFSGGERDVVALCARLALSEVVGSAALRPPRFLVLDEVFGSLDSERRSQLLETLGFLASNGHFRQMFIISHVDDVQLSPVMHEAWTIEEREGVSRVLRSDFVIPAGT